MKTKLAAAAGALALAVPVTNAVAVANATAAKTVTKKIVGSDAQADRWGTVQINVTAKITGAGKSAKVRYSDLGGNYTYHTSRSQFIMSQALPILRQEFLSAQSANIQMVSGATYTSQAFEQSLQSALLKLKK
jgi:uncharacterized protein with FMN-binding domain